MPGFVGQADHPSEEEIVLCLSERFRRGWAKGETYPLFALRKGLRHRKYIHGDRADRLPLAMDESADFLSRCTGKSGLATSLANLRRNVLDQHPSSIDREHLAHKLVSCGGSAADVTLEHSYLRLR